MSLNSYLPHVLVIPEDEALGDAGTGFAKVALSSQFRVEPEVGGRDQLLRRLESEEIPKLRTFPKRLLVLLTDFDNGGGRQEDLRKAVPVNLRERVFVLGPRRNFEALRSEMLSLRRLKPNTRERVGEVLGESCATGDANSWSLEQLTHLKTEVDRASNPIRNILWPPN